MDRIDRYLAREIVGPFAVGLALFFVVVSFGELLRISDAVTGLGIGARDFFAALLYSLPPLLGLLLPISGLFATLLAVGRLAADRELVAMAAAGRSPYRLLLVPAAFGVLLGCGAAVALFFGEPWGIRGVEDILARGAQRALAEGVRVGQLTEWVDGVTFLARGREDGVLTEVMLADRRDPDRPVVVSARRGRVRAGVSPSDLIFDLEDGGILMYESERPRHRWVHFEHSRYRLDVGALVDDKLINVTRAQRLYPDELRAAIEKEAGPRKALFTVTLHRKAALPVATLIFALMAVPLAARSGSGARARGFLYSAAIVAGYYYVGRATELSARSGGIPAELAAWIPNGVGLVVLLLLLRHPRRLT